MALAPSPSGANNFSSRPATSTSFHHIVSRPPHQKELPTDAASPLLIVGHSTSAKQNSKPKQHITFHKEYNDDSSAERPSEQPKSQDIRYRQPVGPTKTRPPKQFPAKRRKHQHDHSNIQPAPVTDEAHDGRICMLLAAAPGIQQLSVHVQYYRAQMDSGHVATAMYRLAQLIQRRTKSSKDGLKPRPWVPPVFYVQQTYDDEDNDINMQSGPQELFYDQQQVAALVLLLLQLAQQRLSDFDAATAITMLWSFGKVISEGAAQQPSSTVLKRLHKQGISMDQPSANSIEDTSLPRSDGLEATSNNRNTTLDEVNQEYMSLYCSVCKHLALLGVEAARDNANQKHRLRSHQFMMLTWAATQLRLEVLEEQLWPAIIKRMSRLVRYLSARDTITLAWCAAKSRIDDTLLFELITKRLHFMLRGEEARLLTLPPKIIPVQRSAATMDANAATETTNPAVMPNIATATHSSMTTAKSIANAALSSIPTTAASSVTLIGAAAMTLHDMQAMHSNQHQMPALRQPIRPAAYNMPAVNKSSHDRSLDNASLPLVTAPAITPHTATNQAGDHHTVTSTTVGWTGVAATTPTSNSQVQSDDQQPSAANEGVATQIQPGVNAKDSSRSQPFHGQDISNLLIAYAETGQSLKPLLPALETVALSVLSTMTSQHLANISFTLAKTHTRLPRLCTAIYHRATDMADQQLPAVHMAQLVWAAAQQRNLVENMANTDDMDWQYLQQVKVRIVSETDLLKHLAAPIAACANQLDACSATMVAWAYARMGVAAPQVFEEIAKTQANKIRTLDHRGLATMLWAFDRSRSWQAAFFGKLLKHLESLPLETTCMSQIGSLHMVMMSLAHLSESGPLHTDIMLGGAKLVKRHAGLIKRLAFILQSRLDRCTSQEVSNLAWAAAQLGYAHPQLLADISDTVLKVRNRSPLHVSITSSPSRNGFWDASFDTSEPQTESKEPGPSTTDGDSNNLLEQSSTTNSQAASNKAVGKQSAFRLRRYQAMTNGQVRSKLKGPARSWCMLDDMKAIECAKLVWAYAKAGHVDEELFAAVTERFVAIARRTSPKLTGGQSTIAIGTAARTLWAYAMQGRHDDEIFPLLMPHAAATMRFAEPRDVAAMLWAMAASGQRDNGLIHACVKHAVNNARKYSCSQVSDTMWALGVMQKSDKDAKRLGPLTKTLIDIVKQRVITDTVKFRVHDIAAVMTGLSGLQHQDTKLSFHVATHVSRQLQAQHTIQKAGEVHDLNTVIDSSIEHASDTESSSLLAADNNIDITAGNEEGADSEHVVALVYSFASMGQFHPTFYRYAALVLWHRLHLLDTEQLVQLIWSYSSTLHHVRPQRTDVVHQGSTSSDQNLLATTQRGDLESVYCRFIAAAATMLDQATPVQQSSSLTSQELSLLWQAHHCCVLWAHSPTAAITSPGDAQSNQQLQNLPAPPNPHAVDCRRPPYQLHDSLIQKKVELAGLQQLATHSRRDMAELVAGLEALGFSTLGPSMAAFDEVLAGCGPDWLGAVQGHMKLAVMLVTDQHMRRGAEPQRFLMAEHWVKARLLAARGWIVVPLLASDFRQRSHFNGEQSDFLRSEINKVMNK